MKKQRDVAAAPAPPRQTVDNIKAYGGASTAAANTISRRSTVFHSKRQYSDYIAA